MASLDTLIDRATARGLMAGEQPVAVDIGANIGTHAVYLASRFARVHAFEPNEMIHHVLSANLALNGCHGVVAHRVALSDAEETLTYRQDASGNLGGSGFAHGAENGAAAGVPMRLARADRFILEQLAPGETVAFVKIDVEGLEDKVVRGLERVLMRDKPLVICEVAGQDEGRRVVATLRQCGHAHLYEIHNAARFGAGAALTRGWRALTAGIGYELRPIADFEPRIYPMIVAAPVDLLA